MPAASAHAVATVAEIHGTINEKDSENMPSPPSVTGDVAPVPPIVMSEAEKLAADAVAKTTRSGPLSWMDVIGGAESGVRADNSLDAQLARETQAVNAMADPLPPAHKPVSWDDIVNQVADTGSGPAGNNAAGGAVLKSPLSWMDVIGATDNTQADTTPVAPPAPKADPRVDLPASDLPAKDSAQAVKTPLSWMDVIGGGTESSEEDK